MVVGGDTNNGFARGNATGPMRRSERSRTVLTISEPYGIAAGLVRRRERSRTVLTTSRN